MRKLQDKPVDWVGWRAARKGVMKSKRKKLLGGSKSKQGFMRGVKEIWRVNTMSCDGIQPYSEGFVVEEETDFPT